jgi:thymidylate kinase
MEIDGMSELGKSRGSTAIHTDFSGLGPAQLDDGLATSRSQTDFLGSLFRLLDESETRYCVLHSWEQVPEILPSDLDIAVHPQDRSKLSRVFEGLQREGYVPFQCLNYSTNACYFVFSWSEGSVLKAVAIDIISEHRRSGMILSSGDEIVAERTRHGEFWISSEKMGFAYLLAKRCWKGGASPSQSLHMKHLAERLGPAEVERIAATILSGRFKRRVIDACASGAIGKELEKGRAQLRQTAWSRHPARLIRYLSEELRRVIRRWTQPTGVFLTVLGPDGVGKSTAIDGFSQSFDFLSLAFRGRKRLFHWRPMVLFPTRISGSGTYSPAKPARGSLMSMIYLVAFFIDYWVGYLFVIRPLLTKSVFVLFDRYFYDVLVDPMRYGYGGPQWLTQLLCRLAPEPDIVVLLDAEEQIVFARKNELSIAEIKRQREEYRQLQKLFKRAQMVVVKTESGIESTRHALFVALIEFMQQRFVQRFKSWRFVPR